VVCVCRHSAVGEYLYGPKRTVTPTGTTNFCMARGTACIDTTPNTSSMAMSRTFRCCTSQERPPRCLHSRHTGSHYIDDPPDTGPYIQQHNIRFYPLICKCTNNPIHLRESSRDSIRIHRILVELPHLSKLELRNPVGPRRILAELPRSCYEDPLALPLSRQGCA
jgi:hypothetical protein